MTNTTQYDPSWDKDVVDMTDTELRNAVGELRAEIVRRGCVESRLRDQLLNQAIPYSPDAKPDLDSRELYELMQAYRLSKMSDSKPNATVDAYEAVKAWLRNSFDIKSPKENCMSKWPWPTGTPTNQMQPLASGHIWIKRVADRRQGDAKPTTEEIMTDTTQHDQR